MPTRPNSSRLPSPIATWELSPGVTPPWQRGQSGQPRPEPVSRTPAPEKTIRTSTIRAAQARRRHADGLKTTRLSIPGGLFWRSHGAHGFDQLRPEDVGVVLALGEGAAAGAHPRAQVRVALEPLERVAPAGGVAGLDAESAADALGVEVDRFGSGHDDGLAERQRVVQLGQAQQPLVRLQRDGDD